MTADEFDNEFIRYRGQLRQEILRFGDSVASLRTIWDRSHDHLPELNLAPGFFHIVEQSLLTTIVMWGDKLLDEHSERGLFNFLTFIEYNRKRLSVGELQRRRDFPNDHPMLRDRRVVDIALIDAHRTSIRQLPALQSIKLQRDKHHGHFDKRYFLDRAKLNKDAPLRWEELEEAGALMSKIVDCYSNEFDGSCYVWSASPVDDLVKLLHAAHRGMAGA